jgi:uncharacterized protein with HEPN domain
MTRHDDATTLRQMQERAIELVRLVAGRSREDLGTDRTFELAVLHLLAILGEAAARASGDLRTGHPELPWRDMVDLRNYLIHVYDRVNHTVVWHTVSVEIPRLVEKLERILR